MYTPYVCSRLDAFTFTLWRFQIHISIIFELYICIATYNQDGQMHLAGERHVPHRPRVEQEERQQCRPGSHHRSLPSAWISGFLGPCWRWLHSVKLHQNISQHWWCADCWQCRSRQVEVHQNLTCRDIEGVLEAAGQADHSNAAMIAVVVLRWPTILINLVIILHCVAVMVTRGFSTGMTELTPRTRWHSHILKHDLRQDERKRCGSGRCPIIVIFNHILGLPFSD